MATTQTQQSAVVAENNDEPFSAFSLNGKRYIVFLVASAGWFSTLSSFIYYPVISLVATDLRTTVAKINLTVTSYLAISGVAPAFVGDAADVLGRRPFYVITLSIYLIANVGIAVQDSFVALLLLRMLQSAGISGKCVLFLRHEGFVLTVYEVRSQLHMVLLPIYQRLQREVPTYLLYHSGRRQCYMITCTRLTLKQDNDCAEYRSPSWWCDWLSHWMEMDILVPLHRFRVHFDRYDPDTT